MWFWLGNYLQWKKKDLLRNIRLCCSLNSWRNIVRHDCRSLVPRCPSIRTDGWKSTFLSPQSQINYEKDLKRKYLHTNIFLVWKNSNIISVLFIQNCYIVYQQVDQEEPRWKNEKWRDLEPSFPETCWWWYSHLSNKKWLRVSYLTRFLRLKV